MTALTDDQIQTTLNLVIEDSDIGDVSVRTYLHRLLRTLWIETDGFSGKRPFGNSSWQYDVYKALIVAELIEGELDEDGYLEDCDDDAGEAIMLQLIDYLFRP